MDKFSELKSAAVAATPGPWEWFTSNSMARLSSTPSGKDGDVLSAFRASDGVPCVSVSQRDMAFIAAANPAVILALLAELEVKDERIGELEVIATEYAGKFQKAQDANKHLIIMSNDDKKRIAELESGHQEAAKQIASWRRIAKQNIEEREKDLAALDAERQKITELEKRLATPVRLPALLQPERDAVNEMIFANGRNEAIAECSVAIRQAGFLSEASPMTIEGDE
ncbi:hypothetical protein BVG94_02500 [Serratia marcescens]|uniref:ead/Ea22-like family protein n=1 Tax=Serratia marcescens TaxID=615 RepID=UPI000B5E9081|nr:ead/Ea22-like family protein [Serratia marcescens]ASL91586.1 hypothetical protein BVG94_02500 [Serratia marcescens]